MNLSWIKITDLVEYELRQQLEEGQDVTRFRQDWQRLQQETKDNHSLRHHAIELLRELTALPLPQELSRREPSTLPEIRALCSASTEALPKLTLANDALADRIAGGWLGRAAGCLLGKPVEKHPRAAIKEILQSNGSWPLANERTAEKTKIKMGIAVR